MFRPAERYPETVVNRVLGRYYEDVATLRRMLVDEEFLQRRAGVYGAPAPAPRVAALSPASRQNGPLVHQSPSLSSGSGVLVHQPPSFRNAVALGP